MLRILLLFVNECPSKHTLDAKTSFTIGISDHIVFGTSSFGNKTVELDAASIGKRDDEHFKTGTPISLDEKKDGDGTSTFDNEKGR